MMIKIYVYCQDRQARTNKKHIAGVQNKMATGLQNELDGVLVVSIEQAVAAPYCGPVSYTHLTLPTTPYV